eukprot:CAMPEP_0184299560 /NCGR_PEP_ID=MMETSP1049-20130417/10148_1 /TAXON_ID=77928 /ORGANISM="Proteomonas sulcata, Strain CCMP704" /LENGTH=160 /DNA_ID=CAMNT_0026610033 /DNA_START=530 /DNA_END=1012 /DNA_ORIENTATION=+
MMSDPALSKLKMSGFITEECLDSTGTRIGFDVVTLDGKRGVLARKGGGKGPKTGQYTVDVSSFESLALHSLDLSQDVDIFIIDEIGRMELHSDKFKAGVDCILDAKRPIFGSIAAARYGRGVPYCEDIKARDDVLTLNLTKSNRNQIANEVAQALAHVLD